MARSDRLFSLVDLLSGPRARTLREIADRLEISPRTAYRDLASLGGRQVPIVRDEAGYRLEAGARLRPLALTVAERAVLKLALTHPSLRRSSHLSGRLATLEAKLDAIARLAEESLAGLAVAGPERTGPVAPELAETVEDSIDAHQTLVIEYRSLSGGQNTHRQLDPYAMVHRAGAWYVIGHCHLNRDLRTFRLDRIRSASLSGGTFRRPADFDVSAYFDQAWNVWRGAATHQVVLRFDPNLAPLLEHAEHHEGEQVITLPSGEIDYRVQLSHLEEIAQWVVGFGGRCLAVEPPELVERVREIATGALDRHREKAE